MNRRAEISAKVIIWWFRAIVTMIVCIFLVLINQAYITVEPPSGMAERALLIERLLWSDEIARHDPVTLERYPGQIDLAVLQDKKSRDAVSESWDTELHYPGTWSKRAVIMRIEGVSATYHPSQLAELKAAVGITGPSGSKLDTKDVFVLGMRDDGLTPSKASFEIYEQGNEKP